jgi:hypothetical protein
VTFAMVISLLNSLCPLACWKSCDFSCRAEFAKSHLMARSQLVWAQLVPGARVPFRYTISHTTEVLFQPHGSRNIVQGALGANDWRAVGANVALTPGVNIHRVQADLPDCLWLVLCVLVSHHGPSRLDRCIPRCPLEAATGSISLVCPAACRLFCSDQSGRVFV